MKLKQLSTEFEYFTPQWQFFGHILLRILAYIFIPQIWILQIFSNLSHIVHRIFTILPQKEQFMDLLSLAL